MKIDNLSGLLFSVPVDFDISQLKIKFSRHFLVTLNVDGVMGVGEGVLYKHNLISAKRILEKEISPFMKKTRFKTFKKMRQNLWEKFGTESPSLVCAIDAALWDVQGKKEGAPLNKLVGKPKRGKVEITEQIFIKSEKTMRGALKRILGHGTKNVKVKAGRNPKRDIDLVKRVRRVVGSDINLRVDANQAYTPQQAIRIGKELKKLEVLAIEEPVPKKYWGNLKRIKNDIEIPIMLDESVMTLSDLKRASKLGAIDMLNIKLARVGGISKALEYVKTCEEKGARVSVGCNEELGVGMSTILHFASILGNLYSTEGVGALRLGFDIVDKEFTLKNGFLEIPKGNGLGINIVKDKLTLSAQRGGFGIYELGKKSPSLALRERWNIWYNRWFNFWILLKRRL